MEYGLGQVVRKYDLGDGGYVLILVLMEYGLGPARSLVNTFISDSS